MNVQRARRSGRTISFTCLFLFAGLAALAQYFSNINAARDEQEEHMEQPGPAVGGEVPERDLQFVRAYSNRGSGGGGGSRPAYRRRSPRPPPPPPPRRSSLFSSGSSRGSSAQRGQGSSNQRSSVFNPTTRFQGRNTPQGGGGGTAGGGGGGDNTNGGGLLNQFQGRNTPGGGVGAGAGAAGGGGGGLLGTPPAGNPVRVRQNPTLAGSLFAFFFAPDQFSPTGPIPTASPSPAPSSLPTTALPSTQPPSPQPTTSTPQPTNNIFLENPPSSTPTVPGMTAQPSSQPSAPPTPVGGATTSPPTVPPTSLPTPVGGGGGTTAPPTIPPTSVPTPVGGGGGTTALPTVPPTVGGGGGTTALPTVPPTVGGGGGTTALPTVPPTSIPTPVGGGGGTTALPTVPPTSLPTPLGGGAGTTAQPTSVPTPLGAGATAQPTSTPTVSPTIAPTSPPTSPPTLPPTRTPTVSPTNTPTPPASQFNIELLNMGNDNTYDEIFARAARRWEEIIVGELDDYDPAANGITDVFFGNFATPVVQTIDDLLIGYEFTVLQPGVLGSAGPLITRRLRGESVSAVSGVMRFNSDSFSINRPDEAFAIILHEMGHVLGFGTFWTGRCGGDCPADFIYDCSRAAQEYANLNLQPPDGSGGTLLLANDGGAGSECGHWDDESFNAPAWSDLMTPFFVAEKAQLITRVSVGAIEDLEGYTVNYGAADPIPVNLEVLQYSAITHETIDLRGKIEHLDLITDDMGFDIDDLHDVVSNFDVGNILEQLGLNR